MSNYETILHYLIDRKKNLELAKYIMIRSIEISSHVVDHPKYNDLDDEATFDHFIRKNEREEKNGEKVIKWKRGMKEMIFSLISPPILEIPLDKPKFYFDKISRQLAAE